MCQQLDQHQFGIRMEWGLRGAQAICGGAHYAVVIDVLSFTTTVSVAVDQQVDVFPYPWHDNSAGAFARQHRAVLAIGRSEAAAATARTVSEATAATARAASDVAAAAASDVAADAVSDVGAAGAGPPPGRSVTPSQPGPISLSPASVRGTPGLDRIVLPSPNGSALVSTLASSGPDVRVLAACLRNRTAIATWLSNQPCRAASPRIMAVIAAGERWPDGSLRPAAEDLWGAGAVIAALAGLGVTGFSPEARSAAAAWRAIEPTLGEALATCSSGAELAGAGFSGDVAIAGELDASRSVPVLTGLRFTDASRVP